MLIVGVLLVAGCSDTSDRSAGPEPSPEKPSTATPANVSDEDGGEADGADDDDEDATLLPELWEAPLYASGRVYAVSQGHWLATGTVDNSPGTTNPTPNVQLSYGIGDAETGRVRVVQPLNQLPSTVSAVPGADLFVAVGGAYVGVLDPSRGRFLWKRRATIGDEVVDMSASRIWMGRTTTDGNPICFTVDTGKVVRHDTACLQADIASNDVVDGVRLQANSISVALPPSELVPDFDEDDVVIPVTQASDDESSESLWSYGDLAIHYEDEEISYTTSTFTRSDLGLVRVDYSRSLSLQDDQKSWPDAVLQLVDARTGEVVRTFGRVTGGTLIAVAGDVAIFEQADASEGTRAVGYRLVG